MKGDNELQVVKLYKFCWRFGTLRSN